MGSATGMQFVPSQSSQAHHRERTSHHGAVWLAGHSVRPVLQQFLLKLFVQKWTKNFFEQETGFSFEKCETLAERQHRGLAEGLASGV